MALADRSPSQRHGAKPVDLGAHVFTLDGVRLGKVCEVHPEYFKLDVSLKPDYWLSRETVWSSDLSGVHVNFRRDELSSFEIEDPARKESGSRRLQQLVEEMREHRDRFLASEDPGS
jgi:hypothetical protein